MTIHYHGTPITPRSVLETLTGKNFCVSHAHPQDIAVCDRIGQSLMLDNGAFSKWRSGKAVDWQAFYEWSDKWLDRPTNWAVIPDDIEGDVEMQDALIGQWPHGLYGAPVWHMHEPISRFLSLLDAWPKVCVGSSAQYASVGNDAWRHRMDAAWEEIERRHRRTPWVHMLRGMQTAKWQYPFASVDSADVARNHAGNKLTARQMADRWDAMQCPPRFEMVQGNLFDTS